jgi:hypothetical protein
MGVGQGGEQIEIHSLVDHAEETEPRTADRGLVVGHRVDGARLHEMTAVDARREGVNVRMPVLLRLVEAVAAGEDDVGRFEQLALELEQQRRGELEIGELVHAVVDGGHRLDLPREVQHHRRVVPAHDRSLLAGQIDFEQRPEQRIPVGLGDRFGQLRRHHDHAGLGAGTDVERRLVALAGDRLFPEDDPVIPGEAAHEVLRPLKDEIPPEVRETDQCIVSD